MGYDRIRPSLDIESNFKSGIVRGADHIEVQDLEVMAWQALD